MNILQMLEILVKNISSIVTWNSAVIFTKLHAFEDITRKTMSVDYKFLNYSGEGGG